jgi:hypothetical protein
MATVTKDFRVKAGIVVEGSTATVNGHDVLTEALVDVKGDLLVASAADTVTRLAAGTNGHVLTANSGATNGIEWAAPAAVGVFDTAITFEGTTADDYETTLTVTDPTADRTITLPNATGTVVLKDTTDTLTNKSVSLTTNTVTGTLAEFNTALSDADFATLAGTETLSNKTLTSPTVSGLYLSDGSIVVEGATANDYETTLQFTDPTEDRTITFKNESGTVAFTTDIPSLSGYVTESGTQTLTNKTLTSPLVSGLSITDGSIVIEGTTANDFETTLTVTDPTADRTITFKDETGTVAFTADVDTRLALAGGTMTGAIAMGTNKITGLGTPTEGTDAATKNYVDSAAQGIDWKASVRVATTTNLVGTYDNEAGTITGNENVGLEIDGISLDQSQRVLVKNQTTASQNGIYSVNAGGGFLSPWVLIRSTDADTGAELTSNFAVFVEEGTVNADQGYVLTNDGAITVGTTALTFTQFTGLGQVVAGDGLAKTGNTLSVNAGTGISITGDAVTNSGVLSIAGTANQITASASTGAITLSGPQDLHSAATPTFAGVNAGSGSVTAGSITLTDALLGTATATASTSATTIDTWSATTYSSAKYIVQMKKAGNIEVIELLVTVDGSNNVYLTEYADVISNTELGTTNAVYDSGNVLLQVTGASSDTVVKVNKVYIEA